MASHKKCEIMNCSVYARKVIHELKHVKTDMAGPTATREWHRVNFSVTDFVFCNTHTNGKF